MIEHLDTEGFKTKVFNFDANKDWKFEGNEPCIVDFYANWCGPCKKVAPILEELLDEYKDKLTIYKVNTEDEQMLSSVFAIKSIPAFLFIPLNGPPQMATGALPKETFRKIIKEVLNVE